MSLCPRQWCWYTHTVHGMHIYAFPHKEALSCDALCGGCPSPFLPRRRWMSWNPRTLGEAPSTSQVQLNWTAQLSRDRLNITPQSSSIVHLFSVLLCMTKIHTRSLIMAWTSLRRRDLMLPVSFSPGKPRSWQSDWIVLKWRMTMCFHPSARMLLIYVPEEWEWSCSVSVQASHWRYYMGFMGFTWSFVLLLKNVYVNWFWTFFCT